VNKAGRSHVSEHVAVLNPARQQFNSARHKESGRAGRSSRTGVRSGMVAVYRCSTSPRAGSVNRSAGGGSRRPVVCPTASARQGNRSMAYANV